METKSSFDINFFIGILLIFGIIWFMGQPTPSNTVEPAPQSIQNNNRDIDYKENVIKDFNDIDLNVEEEFTYLSNSVLNI